MAALRKKHSKLKTALLVIFLGVICIGGMELAVCRVMDPALYARITDPVKDKVVAVMGNLGAVKSRLVERIEAQVAPAEPLEPQYAADPTISNDSQTIDESVTKLEVRGEEEVLTGGARDIIYYNQMDPAWRSKPFGSDQIGYYGCGPTVMSMAVSSLTSKHVNPADMAKWAKDNRHWAKKRGSYLSVVEGAGTAFGLRVESLREFDGVRLRQELASGNVVVALMTKGHFTQGGHFILLRGVTLGGEILVADPSSRERSLMVWDAQLIFDELSPSRHNGAPLWILSSSEEPR